MKLQARLAECESTVDNLGTKLDNLEKSKAKLQSEIEDVSVHVEAAAAKANQMEKRIKQFDKIIGKKNPTIKIYDLINFSNKKSFSHR